MKTYILYINKELSVEYANDCLGTCDRFNIDAELFEGIHGKQNRELTRMTGYRIRTTDYASEYCGTVGHINIWKKIAASNEVGVVLEHDCVVMADYNDIEVNDGEILFLGPRMFHRSHYEFPVDEKLDFIDVEYYNGAHAYAITPNTAAMMLDQLEQTKLIQMPIDGLLGLKNKFGMKLKTVDPSVVISEIGGHRKSFNFDKPDTTNRYYFPKFLKGIRDRVSLPPIAEYDFTVDWFTSNIPHWENTFKLVNKEFTQPLQILEIGAYEGRSTTWISDNLLTHLDSRLHTIDTFEGSVEHDKEYCQDLFKIFARNIGLSKNAEKISPIVGDSRVFMPRMITQKFKYDLIYVDGAHMPENIILDGLCAYHLLKDDGVIIFDDYEWVYNGERTVKAGLDTLETLVPIEPILTGWQRSYVKK